jgi:hypothetical protein
VTVATGSGGGVFGPATHVERDEVGEQRGDGVTYGTVLPAGGATAVRVTSDRPLGQVIVLAMADGERVVTYRPVPARPAGADVNQPPIKSRAEWNADESLRFRGKREVWPTEFWPVQKAIVHHTAGANNDPDPDATVRAIYHYHAVTQGWGDIGYHFLISEKGTIYKGRHSHEPGSQTDTITGEDSAGRIVTAGHTYQHNTGTIGVALLGNFVDVAPVATARASLVEFLAWKVNAHDDVLDTSDYPSTYTNPVNGVSKELPDIAGHLDAVPTECPGRFLHENLPAIRVDVQRFIDANASNVTTTSSTTLPASTTTTVKGRKPR